MIYFRNGDLLESECDYICHQVNCQGKMNSGIAKSIREKWPIVFQNYIAKCEAAEKSAVELYGCYEMAPCGSDLLLGNIQFVPLWTDFEKDIKHQSVVNLFAQQYYVSQFTKNNIIRTILKNVFHCPFYVKKHIFS